MANVCADPDSVAKPPPPKPKNKRIRKEEPSRAERRGDTTRASPPALEPFQKKGAAPAPGPSSAQRPNATARAPSRNTMLVQNNVAPPPAPGPPNAGHFNVHPPPQMMPGQNPGAPPPAPGPSSVGHPFATARAPPPNMRPFKPFDAPPPAYGPEPSKLNRRDAAARATLPNLAYTFQNNTANTPGAQPGYALVSPTAAFPPNSYADVQDDSWLNNARAPGFARSGEMPIVTQRSTALYRVESGLPVSEQHYFAEKRMLPGRVDVVPRVFMQDNEVKKTLRVSVEQQSHGNYTHLQPQQARFAPSLPDTAHTHVEPQQVKPQQVQSQQVKPQQVQPQQGQPQYMQLQQDSFHASIDYGKYEPRLWPILSAVLSDDKGQGRLISHLQAWIMNDVKYRVTKNLGVKKMQMYASPGRTWDNQEAKSKKRVREVASECSYRMCNMPRRQHAMQCLGYQTKEEVCPVVCTDNGHVAGVCGEREQNRKQKILAVGLDARPVERESDHYFMPQERRLGLPSMPQQSGDHDMPDADQAYPGVVSIWKNMP